MSPRVATLLDALGPDDDLLGIIPRLVDAETLQYRFPPAMRPPEGSQASDTIADSTKLHADGYTGKGCLIGIVDTGIDATHPLLEGTVAASRDFTGGGMDDRVGHGTLVALIIHYVAPAAQFVVAKVTDHQSCDEATLASAIDWVAGHRPAAINMSIGVADPDPVQWLAAGALGGLVRGKPRPHWLIRALRRHWLHRCAVCEAADRVMVTSPGTVLCLAVGNQRGKVFCPGRGRNLGLAIGAAAWRDKQLGAADYSNFWPDFVAPELPFARGTSFSVPWVTGVMGLMQEAVSATSRQPKATVVPERETAYRAMLSRWLEPEDMGALVASFRADLETRALPPDKAVSLLRGIAQSPDHLLALLDTVEPYADELSGEAFGQRAVLRAVALVDSGRYPEAREAARRAVEDARVPVARVPELRNVEGRCALHLRDFAAAQAAYQAGIDAAGPENPFLGQLYTNLGNALVSEQQVGGKNYGRAITILSKAVELADSPRLAVESRHSLSTPLLDSGQFDRAYTVLEEARRLADDNPLVADKARASVMRNLGIVWLVKGEWQRAVAALDQATAYGLAAFGPCHPEMVDLTRFVFDVYGDTQLLTPEALAERSLRTWQTGQHVCGVASEAAQAYGQIAQKALTRAARLLALEERMPAIRTLLRARDGQVLDDAVIAGVMTALHRA